MHKLSDRPLVTLDIECYRNYFLAMFRRVSDGKTKYFEMFNGNRIENSASAIVNIIHNNTLVTFNGNTYDIPMLVYYVNGASNSMCKDLSDDIILNNRKPWQLEDTYGIFIPKYLDHIDLIEVAPGQASLKLYGARMGSTKLQDLPINPDALITDDDASLLRKYCENDHLTTADLLKQLMPQLELRKKMSIEYGVDLRSKSDAQIAEAVIRKQIETITGTRIVKPKFSSYMTFKYDAPDYLQFRSPVMQDIFEKVKTLDFNTDKGEVVLPYELEQAKITIGNSTYKMGVGGLHSTESEVTHRTDEIHFLVDKDVTSYYPTIILNSELYPAHLGKQFLDVYRSIVNRRIAAKRAGDNTTADSLKITINGSFGKFGSIYSILYSPKLLIQTTVTGQLALLMLIEMLEEKGIPVVSANTDGLVIKCPYRHEVLMQDVVEEWEDLTEFQLESTYYHALHSRDVNSYIAVKEDGSVKLKGAFAKTGMSKNPLGAVVVEAVVNYLTKGTPLLDTIEACEDINKFIYARTVKGGGEWDGRYLGKVVRWYYAKDLDTTINYKSNGNKVPLSDGGRPIMEIGSELPDDIDYEKYAQIAHEILFDVGAIPRPPKPPKPKTKKQIKEEFKAMVAAFDEELEMARIDCLSNQELALELMDKLGVDNFSRLLDVARSKLALQGDSEL